MVRVAFMLGSINDLFIGMCASKDVKRFYVLLNDNHFKMQNQLISYVLELLL